MTNTIELDSEFQDGTRIFFIVLGEGPQQAEVYDAALELTRASAARGVIWIRDSGLLAGRAEFEGLSDGVIALTLCKVRHVVETFTGAQLPRDELVIIIDETYGKAANHC